MAFDGSGVYSLLYTWATEAASPPIAISKLDAEMAGIATGLSSVLLRTGGTLTGGVTVSHADGMTVSSTAPVLYMNESDEAADEKYWRLIATGSTLYLQTQNDTRTDGASPLVIARTGTTVDSIALVGTAVTINAIPITPTAGSFTMELATDTTGGSVLTSGTAYWKRSGNLVTIRMPNLYATTTDTSIYLRGIPAAIQPSLTDTYTQSIMVGGYVDGSAAMVEIRIAEGVAYWGINALAGFASSSAQKGVGFATNVGPVITYHVAD